LPKEIFKRFIEYLTYALKPKPVPIPQLSESASFKDLDAIWRPNDEKPGVILRWFMTEWCNYRCPYCPQEHGRNRFKGSFRVHSFDNYTPKEWIEAIDRNFSDRRVAITITGGEPMLDVKNMNEFLSLLLTKPYINNVRIDTNMSWNPSRFKDLPNKKKLIFNCSLHTSQIKIDSFISKIKKLKELGFPIGIVNYVMTVEQALHYKELMNKLKELNLPLHPNPLYPLTPQSLKIIARFREIFKMALDDVDFFYKTGGNTKGKICYYPSIAYEMNQNGDISVGCFPWISGSIFNDDIPELPKGPVKCPHHNCYCLDKYSFIKGINRNTDLNILKIYGNLIRKRLGLSIECT